MNPQTQHDHGIADGPGAGELIEYARQACVMHRVSYEGTDPQSVRVPPDAVDELVQTLSATVHGKVQQIVPFAAEHRAADAFSGRMWRNLAERCRVERFYLVPSGEHNRHEVQLRVKADEDWNLDSVLVPVNAWGGPPQVPMSTLWLIDDKVVVRQEPGAHGAGSWLVTHRRPELDRARALIESLRQLAGRDEPPIGPDLTERLLESADLLYHTAQMSCGKNKLIDRKAGCGWYHGAWQYLRLFDMVSSPTWHPGFYTGQLQDAIHERGARRVLISGAADYTTLAFVLDAARPAPGTTPVELDVHVVDLCRTPLLACQWYAKRLGVELTVHQADVTRPGEMAAAGGSFDLIVADAFLTRFDQDGANNVLSSWFEMLVPGGTVVTTIRLHPSNEYVDQEVFDLAFDRGRRVTDPIDDFEFRLRERATGWQDLLRIDLETLSWAGRQYAKRMISHDLGDAEVIRKAFTYYEFEFEHQEATRVTGELVGTEYLRIAARRPMQRETPTILD
jgi:SAM-dependent methyltransferase